MLYASVGYSVVIYDIVPEQVTDAIMDIDKQLQALAKDNLLRGTLSAKEQLSLVSGDLLLSFSIVLVEISQEA